MSQWLTPTPTPVLKDGKWNSLVLTNHHTINKLEIQFPEFVIYKYFISCINLSFVIIKDVDVNF